MKPTEIVRFITQRYESGNKRSIHIQGSPGIGKTEVVEQAAKALGIGFMVIHVPLMQAEDYGLPAISNDRDDVRFVVSKEKFPLVGSDCPEKGLFLLDELNQGDTYSQKINANIMQTKTIHGKKLKPGWICISTGNRPKDRSGANRLLAHLKERITAIDLDVSLDDWTNWALNNGVKAETISFLRFRPALLNSFDANAEANATPRSWVQGVDATLGTIDAGLEFESFKGDVGEGAAAEFLGFLKIYRNLPSVDTILLSPAKADLPTDPATLYALCGALSSRTTADNFGRVMDYINRMPPEFSVLYVRDTIKQKPEVQTTKAFIAWASGPGAKLLI